MAAAGAKQGKLKTPIAPPPPPSSMRSQSLTLARCLSSAAARAPVSAARPLQHLFPTAAMSATGADAFERVITGNKSYARRSAQSEPQLWQTLAQGQSPEVLWFGCGDSRVPETTICDCKPGDMFVHRNIANVIVPGDLSSESIIDFAVGAVKVKRIVLCGHTQCGGAINALNDNDLGPALNAWLQPLRDLRRRHQHEIDQIDSVDRKALRLAELNVRQGVETIRANATVRKAMAERGVSVHGVIFDISSGELRVLGDQTQAVPAGLWQHR
ncbi:carbonic anhydrase [Diplodia corticola]|uniref:Carbonic anhydrase n=1 Tax=Diplodia corticola TaxID=236234 RepID=A0A1J9RQS4_9PEZI|nr:carbonic anhydrase [Diplodia corticola]OJD29901.1 carbonic anhydrase [Diplodia corticola]